MLRLIPLLLALLALAACGAQPAQQTQPNTRPAEISAIQVEILESMPAQAVAVIEGGLGDGCTTLGEITQRREGNTITITVPAVHSGAEICTMVYQIFTERVQLEGSFEPGDYKVIVNGVERSFSV